MVDISLLACYFVPMTQTAEVHGRRIESKSLHLRIPTGLWERVWRLASIHNRTFNNMAETLLQYATEVAERQGEEAESTVEETLS